MRSVPADYYSAGQGRWHPLAEGKDQGKKIFFTDQTFGEGGTPQSLLFVPGNPECSYLFRKVLRCLLDRNLPQTRIITLDHIGFGLSDQATRPMTPLEHAVNLAQLIGHLDLARVTMVVHDWGGPIGLGAFLAKPHLLRKLIIINSGIYPIPKHGFTYHNHPFPVLSWARLSSLVPSRYWGAFASAAITGRAYSRTTLIRDILCYPLRTGLRADQQNPYQMQYASIANVKSSKHLARLSGHWCECADPQDASLHNFYERLRRDVRRFWGPNGANINARFLGGQWDPLGCRENARLWLQSLPQLENNMVFYKDAGHFLPEHRFAEIAQSINELLEIPLLL
jgi:pimeloyl-ACP methyl ester carboxylesterase